jgi:hypothetical protein
MAAIGSRQEQRAFIPIYRIPIHFAWAVYHED